MNIILLEQIFHRLSNFDALYCCILLPFLINIKSSKNIYLSSRNSNSFSSLLNYIKHFSNFKFELLLHSIDFLNFKYHNLFNLRLTIDFSSLSTSSYSHVSSILVNPFSNINGIDSLEFYIPKYYELSDHELKIENINTVIITSENTIKKVSIKKVKKFILNNAHKLQTFEFDSYLHTLSLFKINHKILTQLKSENIEELNINSFFINNDFNIRQQLPNLKHLQLDFSNFDSEFNISNLYGYYNTLSLNYVNFRNKKLEDFSNFKNLKTLQLNGVDNISKIVGFNGKKLYLDKCRYIQNFNFQNLNTLYLSSNPFLTGKDTELFKNIKNLDLSDTNIDYLSPNISGLESFIGFQCNNLIEFPYYKNLNTLNLRSCKNLKKINTTKIKNLYCDNCPKLVST